MTDMREALEPCPFCGEQVATHLHFKNSEGEFWTVPHTINFSCWIKAGNYFYSEAEAIAAWNTRAALQSKSSLIDEVREALEGAVLSLDHCMSALNGVENYFDQHCKTMPAANVISKSDIRSRVAKAMAHTAMLSDKVGSAQSTLAKLGART